MFPDFLSVTIVDQSNNVLTDVWIQIKRVFNNVYVSHIGENGKTYLRGKDGERYQIILAKSGYNQMVIENWKFTKDAEIKFLYPLYPKNVWDGMHSDTAPEMYVDTHDGGHAL